MLVAFGSKRQMNAKELEVHHADDRQVNVLDMVLKTSLLQLILLDGNSIGNSQHATPCCWN